ncbi:MAG: prepilin-type N-terminal cleavage/methylation domain-containing protein [Acidobacteriota bacterium]
MKLNQPIHSASGRAGTRASRGFSFVELLVTIIIAGIVFAALVPVFVYAAQVSARDKMRVIALQVALDRIEQIRQLDFDQIDTLAELQAAVGTQATSSGGTFYITYDPPPVVFQGESASSPAYVDVAVKVQWWKPGTAAPLRPHTKLPEKPVQTHTRVARQYVGPQIISLDISPANVSGDINASPVTLKATIVEGVDRDHTAKVSFRITKANSTVTPVVVDVTKGVGGAGTNGIYSTASWVPTAAGNGLYVIVATAITNDGISGNSWERRVNLVLNSAPAKVTSVTATAGYKAVNLSWDACTADDFDHFEVWRGTSSGATALVIDNLTANGVTDSDPVGTGLAPNTTYYYVVYAVDKDGNQSPASDAKSVNTLSAPGDITPPTQPGSFAAVRNNDSAALSWTASTDAESPIIACYYIFRDGGTTPFARVAGTARSATDIIGYTVTHSYSVVACNAVALLSAATSTLTVAVGTPPTFNLTVSSNQAATSVNVVQTDALPTPIDRGSKIANAGSDVVWPSLPYGQYKVTATWSGRQMSQSVRLSAALTVPFTFTP